MENSLVRKSLRILVAGGFDPAAPETLDRPVDQIAEYVRRLGEEVVRQGHVLLTGCQTELDATVARAASQYLEARPGPAGNGAARVISYVLQGTSPVHQFGTIIASEVTDWDIGGRQPNPPEVIRWADVVILVGGFYGTFKAANWARLAGKPILPLAVFGGAAKEVYAEESQRFEKAYGGHVERLEYEQVLKSLSVDWAGLAKQTVDLAEKIVTTSAVFVIMSFKDTAAYRDLYAAIQRVCGPYHYEARRVDESNLRKRVIPEIIRQIKQSAFVIADVTEERPNVYYELGFADGVGKEVILVAKKRTRLPFDINDVPVLFWDGFADFEEELRKRVEQIGAWQGHAREA